MNLFADLFTSKKFVAAIAGLVVAILGSNEILIDQEALTTVLAPLMAYIVGQGVADIGKERAKIENLT